MEYLYPFIDNSLSDASVKKYGKDIKWNIETNEPVYDEKGNPVFITGLEAVISWAYRALSTERYAYKSHIRSYGNEIFSLIGKCCSNEIVNSEAQRMIKECLMQNPAVKGIKNFVYTRDNDKAEFSFSIETIYGEEDLTVGY